MTVEQTTNAPVNDLPNQAQNTSGHALMLRSITEQDMDFLFRIYASTREAERDALNWAEGDWEAFLRQKFALQHTQYMRSYINPSFDLILMGNMPVGRLYVDRRPEELHIIDIALLPEYRGQGVGGGVLRWLLNEALTHGRGVGLYVERNNPVLSFYQRLGFQVEADKGVYLYMRTARTNAVQSCQFPDKASFTAHLQSIFAVQSADGKRANLCLEQVECTQDSRYESISLLFSGPATLSPSHETYTVNHPALGEFPLFLGPVHCRTTGIMRYQAVLSSFKSN